MTAKLALNMALVRCAEDISARVGDYLIVSPTGHCLGVYTGKVEKDPAGPALPAPAAAKRGRPPKDMKKVLAGSKGGTAKAAAAAARGTASHRTEAYRARLDERILRLVQQQPGIATPDIAFRLKLDRKDRKNLRTHFFRLEKRGLVRYERAGANDKAGLALFPVQGGEGKAA